MSQLPTLDVSIVVNPLPSELPIEELNELFKGEIGKFEQWFMNGQRERGVLDPTPLISVEHGILRSFMYYLCTKVTP